MVGQLSNNLGELNWQRLAHPARAYISAMPRPYPIAIQIDGRPYKGDWQLMLGGRVCVRWECGGSDIAEVGLAKPEHVAARTLEAIVRADQQRRAEGRAHQERELAKLRKPRRGKNPTDARTT